MAKTKKKPKPQDVNLVSLYDYARHLGIGIRWCTTLAATGRIPGARRLSSGWVVVYEGKLPEVARRKYKR